MTKILAATLSISLCIMIDASIAIASDAKETLQIPKIFAAVKLQDCNHFDGKERRACEATTLRLGYFSWGLVFAAQGFDLAPRILRSDLGAFRDFVKSDPTYSTQRLAVQAFLSKPFKICASDGCGKYLGLSERELEATSAEFNESRRSMICLLRRDRSKDKAGGALHDRTLLTDVWQMQRGLIPSCAPVSTAVEDIIRRAFRS
ncbi:hypothetical protein GR239_02605 [Rhizobium leguminosarum]|uniref:hypothetical protein n=1 Tax=Rhizobium ruizarguesonis TaxID=2081791 RepID=UPI0013B5B2FC|nr:hypothetical protein [Rhizobium ruizarguesonis]MBY5803092.1 hypothetical protein [Rhizobium leguminosarum]NEH82625.1 hypothetical protein [Rhizobium ruizarguesonis]NEJ55111.1 hypothetical protein [Rhizobium ruizarguesonis]NEJ63026.1 hypothetical protein [Rhizobium ruizarguesonis]NEJ99468.1 hypothetical protein [Rhizobium ruizarguesonis]